MEFLDHGKTLASLKAAGFTSSLHTPAGAKEDDPGRLRFAPPEDAGAATIAVGDNANTDGATYTAAASGDDIAKRLDDVLHALHAQEVIAVPVGNWRSTLDTVAFALAEDEDWQEVDAEASLHQHTRDPLVFPPDQRATLLALVGAVLDAGGDDDSNITLLMPDVGGVVEIIAAGGMNITLANPAAGDTLAEKLGAAKA